MEYRNLTLELKDHIATITINRPDISNALPYRALLEMRDLLERCGRDDDVSVVVITGTGKNFSGGGYIGEFVDRIETGVCLDRTLIQAAGRMTAAARRCPKPVIGMINGFAAGAGCGLALACDFRVMTAASKLVTAFIDVALPADSGTLYYLGKMVGISKATELLMTNEPLTGAEASRLGVCRLAAEGKLSEETYAFAQRLSERPLEALARQKALFNEFFLSELDGMRDRESEYVEHCSHLPDFAEAIQAFTQKRKPVFNRRIPKE